MSTSITQPSETRILHEYVEITFPGTTKTEKYIRAGDAKSMTILKLAGIIDYCLTILRHDRAIQEAFGDIRTAKERWEEVKEHIDDCPPEFGLLQHVVSSDPEKSQVMAMCHRGFGKNGALILIDLDLAIAIEKEAIQAPKGVNVTTNLSFICIATLMHELRHWVQGVLHGMGSKSEEKYKRWGKERGFPGESGYMGERRLWGGVVIPGLLPGTRVVKQVSKRRQVGDPTEVEFGGTTPMPWERLYFLARTRAQGPNVMFNNIEIFYLVYVHQTVKRATGWLPFIPPTAQSSKKIAKTLKHELADLLKQLSPPDSEEAADQGPSGSATQLPTSEGGAKIEEETEGQALEEDPQVPSEVRAETPEETEGQPLDEVPQTPKKLAVVEKPGKTSPIVHLPHPTKPDKEYAEHERVHFIAAEDDVINFTPIETDSEGVRKRSYAPPNSEYMAQKKGVVKWRNVHSDSEGSASDSEADDDAAEEQGPFVVFNVWIETEQEPLDEV